MDPRHFKALFPQNLETFLTIRSGAQTGVDRGALDAALLLNVRIAGWIPKNRLAYTPIPKEYDEFLKEMTDAEFPQLIGADEEALYCARTEQNVIDSDASLIIIQHESEFTRGTKMTFDLAKKHGKPYFVCDLSKGNMIENIVGWILLNEINVLNVGGPNERKSPGIHDVTMKLMLRLLRHNSISHVNEYNARLKL